MWSFAIGQVPINKFKFQNVQGDLGYGHSTHCIDQKLKEAQEYAKELGSTVECFIPFEKQTIQI